MRLLNLLHVTLSCRGSYASRYSSWPAGLLELSEQQQQSGKLIVFKCTTTCRSCPTCCPLVLGHLCRHLRRPDSVPADQHLPPEVPERGGSQEHAQQHAVLPHQVGRCVLACM